ncbi:MAG: hypothetical protein NTY66_03260, partial [Candidatus Vogelbacteria bacterium]|nr:hypothetical protein [Candidatus Vogelbacteria bacterium]
QQVDFMLYSRGYFVPSTESLIDIPADIANQILGTSTQPTWGRSFSLLVGQVSKLTTTMNALVEKVVDGVVYLRDIVVARLTVDQGVTTKDKVTGEYYCMFVSGGAMKSEKGKCEDLAPTTMLASPVTSSSTASTTGSGSVQPPLIPSPIESGTGSSQGGEGATTTASTSDLVSPPASGGSVTGGVSPSSTEEGAGAVESVGVQPPLTPPSQGGDNPASVTESAPVPDPVSPPAGGGAESAPPPTQ